ncbi:MAG: 3-phosphoshikimate 1-carboxyvinyltransferase [Chromatocurvus sp.]
MEFKLFPGGTISGEVRVPGDKSISHRSVMLSSIAEGESRIRGFLEGEDALATVAALCTLGVEMTGPANGELRVSGVGLHGLRAPTKELDMGNSGTSMRLLSGLLAGQPFASRLTGDESLCRRPMARVMEPLGQMGAHITAAEGDRPPLQIAASNGLRGIHYPMPIASAQVKSCLLLAGLYAEGCTSVTEPAPTRDHTERMLRGFGYEVTRDNGVIQLRGGGRLSGADIDVPADISSAAFFMVAATIAPGSELLLTHVGVNPTRTGIISILTLMGADITIINEHDAGGEPVADILVRHAPLRGIDIPEDQVPLAIDEFPVLFIAAACAEGRTTLSGAEELRVKESDRIASMAEGLATLGIRNEPRPDGIVIEGGAIGGGVIHTHHDHRIAMAFAVAALRAEREIYVMDCDTVATSFPGFDAMARGLGLQISTQAGPA